jgi:hypothetical protein
MSPAPSQPQRSNGTPPQRHKVETGSPLGHKANVNIATHRHSPASSVGFIALLALMAAACDTPPNDAGMEPPALDRVSAPSPSMTSTEVEPSPEDATPLEDASMPDVMAESASDATDTDAVGSDAGLIDVAEPLDGADEAGPSDTLDSEPEDGNASAQEVIEGDTSAQDGGLDQDDATDSGGDSGALPTDCTDLDEDTLCDDGDLCTLDDACREGVCTGALLDCSDKDPCTEDEACVAGACTATTWPDDKSCDGANGCAFAGTCLQGICEPDTPLCPSDDPCKVGACVDEVCVFESAPNFTLCNDDDACTTYDRCISGYCYGSPLNCKDGEPCTVDSCSQDTGECESELLEGCVPGTPAGFATPDVNPYSASFELETTLASFTGKILVGIFHSPS